VEYALKDKHFYDVFKGGVTFSGGEATLHIPFILEAAERLQASGINVALDTSGYCTPELFESAFLSFDYILFDLKIADTDLHKKFTGTANELILKNLACICRKKKNSEYIGEVWIRTPIIPHATDSEENILSIAEIIKAYGDVINRWELCAFNNMCKNKYRTLGITWEYMEVDLLPHSHMQSLYRIAKRALEDLVPVVSTGLTAQDR
jgi:pyruvate formate lyase activating enzyme